MRDPLLLRSPWPQPVPDGYGRAFDFHLTGFAGWLDRAGANARLGLVLCSGRRAAASFVESVGIDNIEVVHTPARLDRPVHPRIHDHQGTHFNRTLFVVDGLDPAQPALFEALDGRAGLIDRTATWVALVIDSLEALGALYTHAPGLAARIGRRCLIIDGHAAESKAAPLDPALLARWRGAEHTAERIYHHAMTPGHMPSLLDVDRLARSGYAPSLVGRVMHPERQRLYSLWRAGAAPRALPFTADQAGPVAATAALREGAATLDEQTRTRLIARLADDESRLAVDAPLPPGLLADLRQVLRGEADAKVGQRLQAEVHRLEPWLVAHAQEGLAAMAAVDGDLEGCVTGLARVVAAASVGGLPELVFDALEKQVQIAVYRDRRSEAKLRLQALEALAPRLHAPFYAARARLARGEFTAPLDPATATLEFQSAERLFRAHGYPTWADSAAEAMP